MATGERKSLSAWLQEAGKDGEVIGLFWAGQLEEAINLAAARYQGEDHKPIMKENNPEKIGKKLKDEATLYDVEQSDAGPKPTYWVLVRV